MEKLFYHVWISTNFVSYSFSVNVRKDILLLVFCKNLKKKIIKKRHIQIVKQMASSYRLKRVRKVADSEKNQFDGCSG